MSAVVPLTAEILDEHERQVRAAVLAEREACAALAVRFHHRCNRDEGGLDVTGWLAAAIRARP